MVKGNKEPPGEIQGVYISRLFEPIHYSSERFRPLYTGAKNISSRTARKGQPGQCIHDPQVQLQGDAALSIHKARAVLKKLAVQPVNATPTALIEVKDLHDDRQSSR